MKYNLYTYYDRVSGIYSAPIPAVNRAVAIRQFVAQIKNAQTVGADDMELYEVGGFDIQSGEVSSVGKPVFVCSFVEYKSTEE